MNKVNAKASPAADDSLLSDALQQYFGFNRFKGTQQKVIQSILDGNDTFVIMPTGGGKSLCYQLPAVILDGTAIIVSPLIALMKNQVDLMRSYSNNDEIAHFINSQLKKSEIAQVRSDIITGKTKLLYIAPETLLKEENIAFFQSINVSFVAVDEAHCISEWGHDFRPEYRQIRNMVESLGKKTPVVALTATATPKVQSDILKNLEMIEPNIFISSFNRDNLEYEIRPKQKKESCEKNIVQYIKQNAGKSGIIYCLSRKTTEELSQTLSLNSIKSSPYHAGLDAKLRSKIQDQFLMEDIDVIVATIAFGMGIDKPDVRFVIHYNIPKSIENYYQETGRAGRDGLEGKCIAYYSHKDVQLLEKLLRDKPIIEREMNAMLIHEVIAYSESSICRRRFLLHYFGETYPHDSCSKCDNCKNPKQAVEGKTDIMLVLQAINEVKENHDLKHIVNIITGHSSQEIKTFKHEKIKLFGKGKDREEHYWASIVRQSQILNFVTKDIEDYGVLKLTDTGRKALKTPPKSILVYLNHEFENTDEGEFVSETAGSGALDTRLLTMLKDLRKQVAKKDKIPTYVIFQESSLEDMATQYPISIDDLGKIVGVSQGKALRYGAIFLELIKNYCEENEIDRPQDMVIKQLANKSAIKVFIIQNTDKKLPLPDIAKLKGIKMADLINEMDSIVTSGTKLNINYYINDVLDEEVQEEIYDYFMESETDDLQVAYDEFGGDFELEELQLMRIKFMSEMAN